MVCQSYLEKFVNISVSKKYIAATSTIRQADYVVNRVRLFDRNLQHLDTYSFILEGNIVCRLD